MWSRSSSSGPLPRWSTSVSLLPHSPSPESIDHGKARFTVLDRHRLKCRGSLVSNLIQQTPFFQIPGGAISWLTHLEGSPGSSATQKERVHQGTNDVDIATSHICSESFSGQDHSCHGRWCGIVDLNQVPVCEHDGYQKTHPEGKPWVCLQEDPPVHLHTQWGDLPGGKNTYQSPLVLGCCLLLWVPKPEDLPALSG